MRAVWASRLASLMLADEGGVFKGRFNGRDLDC